MINYLVFFIGMVMVLLSYFTLRRHQRTYFTSDDQKMREKEKKLAEYIDLAEEIIEELNTVSEQIIQSVDIRTAKMSQLMDDIDKKMKEYEYEMNAYRVEPLNNIDRISKFDDKDAPIRVADQNLEEDPNQLTNSEILRLFDEGNNASQIARRLNKGIGEVQLVLNLRKKQ